MENGEVLSPQTVINTTQNDDQQTAGRARSNSASSGHKRSVSGSLLSKLSFLRMSHSSSADNNEALSSSSHGDAIADDFNDGDPTTNDGYIGGSRAGGTSRAMATAIQHQRKMRRRRGSLRKTALLGTRLEFKDKRNSNASTARDQISYEGIENSRGVSPPLSISTGASHSRTTPPSSTTLTDEELTPRGSMDRDGGRHTSVYSTYWPRSLTMDRGVVSSDVNKSPTSIGDTTDEEDNISLSHFNNSTTTNDNTTSSGRTASTHLRPSSVSSSGSINPPPIATPSSSSDSYFLSSHHHLHHHHQTASANEATDATARSLGRSPTTHRARSPLIAPELSNSASNTLDAGVGGVGGWDYSETEWWGWIILLVTWLVFVVGIGSSFGVWSWAWDVGETPYAPPELEDDPTLPIVGYYPALMVLTAVMAWVWVVVAWVGMKYFKHANIAADDR
jgi:nucleolysin TIA-1/TIAR